MVTKVTADGAANMWLLMCLNSPPQVQKAALARLLGLMYHEGFKEGQRQSTADPDKYDDHSMDEETMGGILSQTKKEAE